ncbi:MAG: proprotein convertase P-domain-containing protein [Novosphingobium sp.]
MRSHSHLVFGTGRLALHALMAALCLLAGLLAAPSAALAQTVNRYTNTTDSTTNGISDTATPCSSRFTRTFTVGTNFAVADVNLAVLMAHKRRSDIEIYLVSPTGNRVQLTGSQGGNADNFNLTFDDEAAASVSTYGSAATATASTVVPPYSASYRPLSALSTFDGQNASGTWTLEVCDNVGGDSGTFFQADLYLTETTPFANLSLTKSVSTSAPATGANISYTLTVANAATSTSSASGIVVRDLLPSGVTFVSATGAGTYNSSTGDWTVGTLAAGQNATLTITATVIASSGTGVTNTAEIIASSVIDSNSTVNNGSTSEDDYASAAFTATATRLAGVAPTLSCPAGTLLFDWDNQVWNAGTTANNYTLTGIGSVGFSITNPAVFLNNAALGGQSPAEQTTVTGGLPAGQSSLAQLVDLATNTQTVRTTITLGTAVSGAQFRIFDVDYGAGQFADKVTVVGYYNGTPVNPTLTNGTANYVIGNSAYGDGTSAETEANGNLVVTFSSPIDQIVIDYGNHSLAPANPGQQAIAIHDITFCTPRAVLSVSKSSTVISDPVNGTSFPKAIPGALVEYCILVANTGPAALTNLSASDSLPANFTYSASTLQTANSCTGSPTAEDDNSTGTDETDPFGAAISGTTVTGTASSLASGAAYALRFRGTVN